MRTVGQQASRRTLAITCDERYYVVAEYYNIGIGKKVALDTNLSD